MVLLKIAIAAFIIYLLWSIVRFVSRLRKTMSAFKAAVAAHQQPQAQNAMVKCAKCQLYVIDREAVTHKGAYFCSLEHAQDFH